MATLRGCTAKGEILDAANGPGGASARTGWRGVTGYADEHPPGPSGTAPHPLVLQVLQQGASRAPAGLAIETGQRGIEPWCVFGTLILAGAGLDPGRRAKVTNLGQRATVFSGFFKSFQVVNGESFFCGGTSRGERREMRRGRKGISPDYNVRDLGSNSGSVNRISPAPLPNLQCVCVCLSARQRARPTAWPGSSSLTRP